jgi:hypothetical protein
MPESAGRVPELRTLAPASLSALAGARRDLTHLFSAAGDAPDVAGASFGTQLSIRLSN